MAWSEEILKSWSATQKTLAGQQGGQLPDAGSADHILDSCLHDSLDFPVQDTGPTCCLRFSVSGALLADAGDGANMDVDLLGDLLSSQSSFGEQQNVLASLSLSHS